MIDIKKLDGLYQKHLADHIPDTTKMMPTGKDSLQVEAMKQSLDALALFASDESDEGQIAIAAHEELSQAIEQVEKQEPVGFVHPEDLQSVTLGHNSYAAIYVETEGHTGGIPLYTSPPQREWVGLTDEEVIEWVESGEYNVITNDWASHIEFARAIEAKLKEKNAYGWQSVSNPTEYLDDLRGGADLCGND